MPFSLKSVDFVCVYVTECPFMAAVQKVWAQILTLRSITLCPELTYFSESAVGCLCSSITCIKDKPAVCWPEDSRSRWFKSEYLKLQSRSLLWNKSVWLRYLVRHQPPHTYFPLSFFGYFSACSSKLHSSGVCSGFWTGVLWLCRQESQLGQHLLRRVPVHRLLRHPSLTGSASQLHQVHCLRSVAPQKQGWRTLEKVLIKFSMTIIVTLL